MGKEFKGAFAQAAESDGTYVDPSAVEAPHQRGITERHGKTFKFMLMKAMDTYNCDDVKEWEELVDITTMTKNRMLQHNGFSPAQRVLGFNPKIPGGLLSDDGGNRALPDKVRQGDFTVERAMKMRRAAAEAFLEADANEALRRAISTGPRPMQDYDIGEMIYFYRMGADKAKKFALGYWCGPARIMMIDQPSTIWASYRGTLVKAAPERVRRASLEENLGLSGWPSDLVKNKHDPCTDPKKGYIDLSEHPLPSEVELQDGEDEDGYEPSIRADEEDEDVSRKRSGPPLGPRPTRRYYGKQVQDIDDYFRDEPTSTSVRLPAEPQGPPELRHQADLPVPDSEPRDQDGKESGTKREHGDEGLIGEELERPSKRSRAEYLELYHMKVENLLKQRQRKEIRLQELNKKNHDCFLKAINKEIQNNIEAGAYRILDDKESAAIRQQCPEKIMESRFVSTAKPLEPQEVQQAEETGLLLDWNSEEACKAKARHVMKGFSEDESSTIEATTPQVTREGALMVAQMIASYKWRLGFLDFTQAFMSGDPIQRTIYAAQPREGIPGLTPGQLLKLEKVCYGLVDGPYAWFQHLNKMLTKELKYQQSIADPCIYFQLRQVQGPDGNWHQKLGGIIAVATDDLLHGGDAEHLKCMEEIQRRYKLGKYQFDQGKFTGKQFTTLDDGSILINQVQYTKEKLIEIQLDKIRKRQRYSFCNDKEISQLRASVGALSWLSKSQDQT